MARQAPGARRLAVRGGDFARFKQLLDPAQIGIDYGGFIDSIPFGAVMNRSLTIKTGQTHVQRYMGPLLERIERGELSPAAVISHRLPLDEAPRGYQMSRDKADQCIKVVMHP